MKRGKLTIKQAKFAHEYIMNGGNGVQAALKSYSTGNYDTANKMAQYSLADPDVRAIIQEAFDELKTTPKKYIKNLDKQANKDTDSVSMEGIIKANVEMLKIVGVYPGVKQTNVNVSMKIKDMTLKEAKEALEQIRSNNNELVSEIETIDSP